MYTYISITMYPRKGARAWGTSVRLRYLCGGVHTHCFAGVDNRNKPGSNLQNVSCFRTLDMQRKMYIVKIVLWSSEKRWSIRSPLGKADICKYVQLLALPSRVWYV